MPELILNRLNKGRQILYSILLVLLVSAVCFAFGNLVDYKITAFVLLLAVSVLAVIFDIIPVLLAAVMSALIWNFFFIEPKYTFRIGTLEDGVLFSMYFVIAVINGVLTYKIRQVEKQSRLKEEKVKTIQLYNTLFNTLSHELKTPIAAIIAATDNLKENNKNLTEENKIELINEVSVASLRLNQQVSNLLSMSRLESGSMQLKKDWCDINELIYSVINRLEENLKKHTVNVSIEANLPLYKLDYVLMEQVLYNLIYNASIYTPEYSEIFITAKQSNSKTYQLNIETEEHSGLANEISYLILQIEDHGKGFPPNEIEKVFDKFYRLQDTKTGGTGLGLSIVKGFVEAHNGTVELENIPHGARFTIKIPAEVSYINNLKNE
jgi:two-component system, OmpR family, sensor histidine kinase KdpD